jgi:hypothetical protein
MPSWGGGEVRYDIATPEVGLALAEIVGRELRRESTLAHPLSAADVLARERPSSLRAQGLERALRDLAAATPSVFLPFEHDELVIVIAKDVAVVRAALEANERRLDEIAELRSRALQRRAEGLMRLLGELHGDGPVVRRAA